MNETLSTGNEDYKPSEQVRHPHSLSPTMEGSPRGVAVMKALIMGTIMGSNPRECTKGRKKCLINTLFKRIGYDFKCFSTIDLINVKFVKHVHAKCNESSTHS